MMVTNALDSVNLYDSVNVTHGILSMYLILPADLILILEKTA